MFVITKRHWFLYFKNLKVINIIHKEFTWKQNKKLFNEVNHYFWDDQFLFRIKVDGLIKRCDARKEVTNIM